MRNRSLPAVGRAGGEGFGELGVYADHRGADQATTHIPAILRWPGLDARVRRTVPLPPRPALRALLVGTAVAHVGEALAALGSPAHTFVCGANSFVSAMSDLLVDAGVPAKSIRTERFGG